MHQEITKDETLREINRILGLIKQRSRFESDLSSLKNVNTDMKYEPLGLKGSLLILVIGLVTFLGGFVISYAAILIISSILEFLGLFEMGSGSFIKYVSLVFSSLATIGIIYILHSDNLANKRKVETNTLIRNTQLKKIDENKEKIRKLQLSIQHATYDIYKNTFIPQAYVNVNDLAELKNILSYYGQASTLIEAIQILEEKKRHGEMLQAQNQVAEQLEKNMVHQQEMAMQLTSQINNQVGNLQKEIEDLNKKIW